MVAGELLVCDCGGAVNSGLLGCDAVSLGKQMETTDIL
jgi:hypothetical protein